jgi:hypothetical protein
MHLYFTTPQLNATRTLQEALAECNTFENEKDIPWTQLSTKHGVVRSTLMRTYRRETRSRKEQAVAQEKLTPQQEEEPVKYKEELNACHIPPTREMIANFASAVAKEPVSESWVTRFINKYSIHLISQYSKSMDTNRHNADLHQRGTTKQERSTRHCTKHTETA